MGYQSFHGFVSIWERGAGLLLLSTVLYDLLSILEDGIECQLQLFLEVLFLSFLIASLSSNNLLLRLKLVQVHAITLVAAPAVEEVLTVLGVAVAASDDVLVVLEFKKALSG